jgi:hypothetical protein
VTEHAEDTIRISKGRRFGVISVPLFLLWIVFLPMMLGLSPLILIACVISEVNPFHIFSTMWQMIDALAGAEFEIRKGKRTTVIRIG